jgi:hypothetical protein
MIGGAQGEAAVARQIEAGGGQILGRNITLDTAAARTRPDMYAQTATGAREFVEVKTGPTARLSPLSRKFKREEPSHEGQTQRGQALLQANQWHLLLLGSSMYRVLRPHPGPFFLCHVGTRSTRVTESPKKTLVHDFYTKLSIGLANIGFKKRKEGIYILPLTDDISGWLGLQRTWRAPNLEIFPTVSLNCQSVERKLRSLAAWFGPDPLPTGISQHLGYLMPKHTYTVWTFRLGKNVSAKVADLVSSVEKFGIPFMEKHTTLQALCETMASGMVGTTEQVVYSLPVGLYLLGRREEALAYLEAELRKLGTANHDAAKLYRRFAEAFSQELCQDLQANNEAYPLMAENLNL